MWTQQSLGHDEDAFTKTATAESLYILFLLFFFSGGGGGLFGSPCGARGRVCVGGPRVGCEELTDINCMSVVPRGRGNVPHLMAEVLLPTGLTGRGLITGKSAWLLTRAPFWITPRGTGRRRNMGSMGSMQEHEQSNSAFSEISSSSFFQTNFG